MLFERYVKSTSSQITVSDPNGREHVLAVNEDGTTHRAEFQPKTNGLHAVRVLWNGISIVGSPFTFNVRSRGMSSTFHKLLLMCAFFTVTGLGP